MAFMLSRGSDGDLAIRFNNRKKFIKEICRQMDEADVSGCHVVVSITSEPEKNYEQEYKKIYRRKTIKDKAKDITKEVNLLKSLLGWG